MMYIKPNPLLVKELYHNRGITGVGIYRIPPYVGLQFVQLNYYHVLKERHVFSSN